MKKLLIKVFCGIIIFSLLMFAGCNSTSEETSTQVSTAVTGKSAEASAPVIPDKEILLSAPPIPDLTSKEQKEEQVSKEQKEEQVSTVESSIAEVSEDSEEEPLVEDYDITKESYETEDGTYEVEEFYEEEVCLTQATEESEEYVEDYEDDYSEEYVEDYEDDYSYEYETNYEEYNYDYSDALYTPSDFQNMGIINWGGWSWTFYSQQAMPGEGLIIPGRHVDYNGYVCDENDYICLASSSLDKGTVVDTPFGKMGKVYDCGCLSYILDVYVDW